MIVFVVAAAIVGAALIARSISAAAESIRAENSEHHRQQRELAAKDRNDRRETELDSKRALDRHKWSKNFRGF